jgi:hypothetical protein
MDVDGTMYDPQALRRRMLPSLCMAGWRTLRIIRAYRRALESLRDAATVGNLEDAQMEVACRETGYDGAVVRACVQRWMEEAPLKYLPLCVYPGLRNCWRMLGGRGFGWRYVRIILRRRSWRRWGLGNFLMRLFLRPMRVGLSRILG